MRDAWWPGLEDRLERKRAEDEARAERHAIEGGWHLPRWASTRGSTPYVARIATGVVFLLLGAVIGRVAGLDDGWAVAWSGMSSALLGGVLVDAWYAVGARRVHRLAGRRAATEHAVGPMTGADEVAEAGPLRADRPR